MRPRVREARRRRSGTSLRSVPLRPTLRLALLGISRRNAGSAPVPGAVVSLAKYANALQRFNRRNPKKRPRWLGEARSFARKNKRTKIYLTEGFIFMTISIPDRNVGAETGGHSGLRSCRTTDIGNRVGFVGDPQVLGALRGASRDMRVEAFQG